MTWLILDLFGKFGNFYYLTNNEDNSISLALMNLGIFLLDRDAMILIQIVNTVSSRSSYFPIKEVTSFTCVQIPGIYIFTHEILQNHY